MQAKAVLPKSSILVALLVMVLVTPPSINKRLMTVRLKSLELRVSGDVVKLPKAIGATLK